MTSLNHSESNQKSVRLCLAENEWEANFIVEMLSSEGITAMLRPFRDSAYDGLFVLSRGWGEIRVLEEDLPRARTLHEEYLKSKGESFPEESAENEQNGVEASEGMES